MKGDGGSKERNIIETKLNGVRGEEDTINTAEDKHTHHTTLRWSIPFVMLLLVVVQFASRKVN